MRAYIIGTYVRNNFIIFSIFTVHCPQVYHLALVNTILTHRKQRT